MAPRIVIAGAGLGGLTLARVLHVHGIAATVLERDASPSARSQGGMLDLHVPTGQLALRRAGLEAEFLAVARHEGQDQRVVDSDATMLLEQLTPDDAPWDRPEVDRRDLRDLLLGALPAGTVRWGCGLDRVGAPGDDGRTLHLADGTTTSCDLVVGADGASSRVRRVLTDAVPTHLGVNVVELGIPDVERTHPELAARVGRGNYWAMGADKYLAAQRTGDGRIRIYVAFRTGQGWLESCGVPFHDPAAARAGLVGLLHGWAPQLTALVAACEGAVVPRALTVLPVGLTWPSTAGVTLLGDAAHLMPPAGEGANLAMLDAAELAQAIVERPDLDDAVHSYESAMFPRSEAAARQSARIQEILWSPADLVRALGG